MSLFERLGRKVESLKQEADAARDAEATHRCRDCGKRFYTQREVCSACGGEVVAVDDGDGGK